MSGSLAASAFVFLCLLERLSAIPTDYIDLARCPDNGSTAGADIFDTAIFRFFASAFGGSQLLQAACIDTGLAYGFSDPCPRLRGQCRYRPAVFLVFFNMQAVGLGGGLKFHVVIIAVVAYVLNVMHQIVKVGHFMYEGGRQLEDRAVKVFGAKVDLPVLLAAGVPDFIDTAPAVCAAPAVRGYGDGRAG